MTDQLATIIDAAWDARDGVSSATKGEVRDAVQSALAGLDDGSYRVAEKLAGSWQVHQWLKKLCFCLSASMTIFWSMAGRPVHLLTIRCLQNSAIGMPIVFAMQVSALYQVPSPAMAAMSAKTSS